MSSTEAESLRFISEPVAVTFGNRRGFEKRPACPKDFAWRGKSYCIVEQLSEWQDHARRGKMAHNMRPSHLAAAEKRGSWGVGRHYFRVRTDTGQVFEIYYDRAPKNAANRKGGWWLLRELSP